MSLYQMLLAAKQGNAFNVKRLLTQLKMKGVDIDIEDLGPLVFVQKNKHVLEEANHTILDSLIDQFSPAKSRREASQKGNSHDHRTHTAYFVAKRYGEQGAVFAISCAPDMTVETHWPKSNRTDVILIENSECFTFCSSFLGNMGLQNIDDDTLVIWSSGKAITHPNAIHFLSHFNHIHYCPDYDLTGVEIYETLFKTLGDKIHFAMPLDLASYAKYCVVPKERMHYIHALNKAKELGFEPMVKLLTDGRGILEQELLIGE